MYAIKFKFLTRLFELGISSSIKSKCLTFSLVILDAITLDVNTKQVI